MLQMNSILSKGFTLALVFSSLLLAACGNKSEAPVAAPETKQENPTVTSPAPTAAAAASASKFDQLLDSYEKIIVEYETVANKDPICNADMMDLVTNVTPKLTEMANDLQGMQTAGADAPSPASMTRYMELTQRYSKVAEQFSKKAGTPSGC